MVKPVGACKTSSAQQRQQQTCNRTALSSGAAAALQFWLVRNPCSKNWFFNQIEGPTILGTALLIMQHNMILPKKALEMADTDLLRGASWWRGWSGMNLAALATLQIYRGLLFDDASVVKEGFAAVWSQLTPMPWPAPAASKTEAARCNSSSVATTACIPDSCQVGGGSYLGDGIQVDGSFHQHGAVIADGSYGPAFTDSLLTFLPWVAGLTEWEPTRANLAAFGTLVLGQRRMALPGAKGMHRPVVETNKPP